MKLSRERGEGDELTGFVNQASLSATVNRDLKHEREGGSRDRSCLSARRTNLFFKRAESCIVIDEKFCVPNPEQP